ncbi:MAG: hypothetical protein P0Y60_11515 [Candidatus Microbacterium colombiense]|nr:MAG: hypothetical protein P0Y60_11515 [Microbacterium sp.]
MKDISRRTVLTYGAWSAPVIALAVSAPLAAASVAAATVTITGIAAVGFSDWHDLYINVANPPAGAQNVTGRVTWTPSGGSTIGSSGFSVDSNGNASITLAGFPTGVSYTFTATVTIAGSPVSGSFVHTF